MMKYEEKEDPHLGGGDFSVDEDSTVDPEDVDTVVLDEGKAGDLLERGLFGESKAR
jgi:hypothetical protein